METIELRNRTRDTVIARAGVARSWLARLRGLIGRRSLQTGEGLVIRPCNSIHTFFMAFPIGVLFVDAGNRVMRATTLIEAWRIGPIVPGASYVVELPVGAIEASQTVCGDELEWAR
jgi:uncharacterized membrane protein (UPF0127 family)